MNDTLFFTALSTVAGVLGTGIGGFLCIIINKKSNKFLSSILEFSAGLMLSVVFLDLLPNAIEKASNTNIFVGVILGILFMKQTTKIPFKSRNSYIKTGLIMAMSIALHNFPEGLAIGASFDVDFTFGLSIMIAILLHDIPEGLALSIPLKVGGMGKIKIIIIALMTGLATGVGGFFGVIVGGINESLIGSCLAIASGAMIYVVIMEMIPKSKQIYKGAISGWFNIFGIVFGVILFQILWG